MILTLAGCQCCQVTEHYQDYVDYVADHEGHLDNWYCAGLDLTRIGFPDWCEYRINRALCGRTCRCCREAPPFIEERLCYCDLNRAAPGNPLRSQPPAAPGVVPPAPSPTPALESPSEPFIPEPPQSGPARRTPRMPDQIERIPDPPQTNPNETIPLEPLPLPPGPSLELQSGEQDPGFVTPVKFEWPEFNPKPGPRPMPR